MCALYLNAMFVIVPWAYITGDKSPQNLEKGTLMQIVPLRFLSNTYKKERYLAFKIRQNPFPDSAGGAYNAPPDPLVG